MTGAHAQSSFLPAIGAAMPERAATAHPRQAQSIRAGRLSIAAFLFPGRTARERAPSPAPRTSPSLFFLLLPAACFAAPAHTFAQPATPPLILGPVKIDATTQSCVDVQVDGIRQPAFECLNEQLKAAAQGAQPGDPNAAIASVAANGAPNKVGTFSHTGEAIRMGNTFGKSAFPQRPAATVFSNTLIAGGK